MESADKHTFLDFKSIAINFGHLAFGEFSSKVFGFLTTVYLARVLGVEGFGLFGFVTAVSGYVVLFSNFGIEQYSMHALSLKESDKHTNFIATVFNTRLLLSCIFIIPFIIVALYYAKTTPEVWLFLFQITFITAYAFNPQFYFIARQKTGSLAIIKIGTAVVILSLSYLIINQPKDLPLVTLIYGTTTLFFFIFGTGYVFYNEKIRLGLSSLHEIIDLVRASSPLGFSALMIQIYYSIDILILGLSQFSPELGFYSGAYRIILVYTTVPAILYSVFMPELTSAAAKNFHAKVTQRYILILCSLGSALVIPSYFFSEEIIIIILGENYRMAIGVFKILLLNVFVVFVNVSIGNLLIAWNQYKKYMVVVAAGAVTNIILNLILIPQYGMYGAAIATIAAELMVFVTALYFHNALFGLFKVEKYTV